MKRSDCENIQAPFSDNYCRDWWMYHGGIFVFGAVVAFAGVATEHHVAAVIGALVMFSALISGLVNYLIDRDFRKNPDGRL